MSSRSERLLLLDIVENADAVAEYLAGLQFAGFEGDRMRVDAVERCLMRITEAVIRIGSERMAESCPSCR